MYTVREYISSTESVTKSYSTTMKSLFVSNDSESETIVLSIHDMVISILPGESINEAFKPFKTFAIAAPQNINSKFRAFVRD